VSSIRLFILDSLSRHGAMHGHQLRLLAEEEHVHLWTDITVGSLYGAIKRLATEGLIAEMRTEREGNFPERQVYGITEAGQASLSQLRAAQLTDFSFRPDPFDLALSRLDPERLHELPGIIEERVRTVRQRLEDVVRTNARALPYLSTGEKFALDHREHRLQGELTWLAELTEALPELIAEEQARTKPGWEPNNRPIH
jgi:DNA-binding PadR family transcriptional regulator